MRAWRVLLAGIVLVLANVPTTMAEVPPRPSPSLPEVMALFPDSAQLPSGMVLSDEGSRGAAELAQTFPDPEDAEDVLLRWAWAFSVYRVYESGAGADAETPARLEISLHQFSNNTGAAYALPYFAHARAVMLDQGEGPVGQLRPCEAAVSSGTEATRYVRIGDLLVRVTATMPSPSSEKTYYMALASATEVAFAVLENAGGSIRELDQTCR